MHADPGLQPERTSMSWSRTAISMLVVSLILLRWADVYGVGVLALIAGLVASSAFVVLSNRADYLREVRGIRDERVAPALARVTVLSAAVLALGAGAIALVLAT
ncbi:DUF202 domain-containing protein [Corynebacterium sp. TA-R-1]|uniref:DUF202 domain-containing protein n=1 Tax=Corynebacterium stercoris TaxID=2943490 RepID=A0ABT1G321_9CORY|nr:DUF202 domain-containing protein [Corynebacterium stercoris]